MLKRGCGECRVSPSHTMEKPGDSAIRPQGKVLEAMGERTVNASPRRNRDRFSGSETLFIWGRRSFEQACFCVPTLSAEPAGGVHPRHAESARAGCGGEGQRWQGAYIFWMHLGPPRAAGSRVQNLGYRVTADQLIRMTPLQIIEHLPSFKRKGKNWFQF